MNTKREKTTIVLAGLVIGIVAAMLSYLGNPKNMGFCIACFIRDTAGALGLHSAGKVCYIRPEIIGIVLGSFGIALAKKEFNPKGGSSPLTRFIIGFFVMIGCLMFLGCPFRMIVRLAGGDLNAIFGLVGLFVGVLCGIFFLNRGYSLGRTHALNKIEGSAFALVQVMLLVLVVAAPAFIVFTAAGEGPGGARAIIAVSLAAGLIVGVLAQRTRLCMIGGFRDAVLFREFKLLLGFVAILIGALLTNLILSCALGGLSFGSGSGEALIGLTSGSGEALIEGAFFKLGFAGQSVAHTDGLWNALGMLLVGFGCTLLGGCPLRQLVMAGEGNSDSAVTIIGLCVGAAFAHNFGLASSTEGPTLAGKIGVLVGLAVCVLIAVGNKDRKNR